MGPYTTGTPPQRDNGEFTWVRQRPKRRIYAGLRTLTNASEPPFSDCGSREGRGFESRRSPSNLQVKREAQSRTEVLDKVSDSAADFKVGEGRNEEMQGEQRPIDALK
jgi:hypothetical protein